MRHVSRNHRVSLDWLLDRINLDSKIQIKYVDTKNQLAEMLTKGSFTYDEWNHLLLLLNIMNFLMFCCCHFLPTESKVPCQQEEKKVTSEEGSPMAKPRPMNLVTANPRLTNSVSQNL